MITINLLPKKRPQPSRSGRLARGLGLAAVLAAAIFLGTHYWPLKPGPTALAPEAAGTAATPEQRLSGLARDWEDVAAVLALEEKRRGPGRVLAEVNRLMPAGRTWLLRVLHEENGRLWIDGVALDHESVARFLGNLEQSGLLRQVRLVDANRDLTVNGLKLTRFNIEALASPPPSELLEKGLPEAGLPAADEFRALFRRAEAKGASAADQQALARQAPALETLARFAAGFMPAEDQMPDLVRTLAGLGSQSGVEVRRFTPRLPAQAGRQYARIPFEMVLEGPFPNLLDFLRRFSSLNRLAVIERLELTRPRFVAGEMVVVVHCRGGLYRAPAPGETPAKKPAEGK